MVLDEYTRRGNPLTAHTDAIAPLVEEPVCPDRSMPDRTIGIAALRSGDRFPISTIQCKVRAAS
jgi:hypothetical protein